MEKSLCAPPYTVISTFEKIKSQLLTTKLTFQEQAEEKQSNISSVLTLKNGQLPLLFQTQHMLPSSSKVQACLEQSRYFNTVLLCPSINAAIVIKVHLVSHNPINPAGCFGTGSYHKSFTFRSKPYSSLHVDTTLPTGS